MSILAAININDEYRPIIDQAVSLSKSLSKKLHLIYVESLDPSLVIDGGGPLIHLNSIIAQRMADNQEKLQELTDAIQKKGVKVDFSLEKGETALAIVQKAKSLKSTMIVMGSHGNTILMDLLTGSTHEGVLHRADCPVLVVPLKK